MRQLLFAGALTLVLLLGEGKLRPLSAAPIRVDAAVLVNSSSPYYLDFQHYLQPYLENFGVPYTIFDIAKNGISTNLGAYALIIIGHKQFDTNFAYLTSSQQTIISQAISNGAGLVNFDSDLSGPGGVGRYQFVQDIFAFTYGGQTNSATVTFPPTLPGSQMHYIASLHATNQSLPLSNTMSLAVVTLPANVSAIALSGNKPLVAVRKYGQGRAVQWTSYDWMAVQVLGPVNGLDDLVWRGMVWAARKPFLMRGMPNLVTLRVDDVEGPMGWEK